MLKSNNFTTTKYANTIRNLFFCLLSLDFLSLSFRFVISVWKMEIHGGACFAVPTISAIGLVVRERPVYEPERPFSCSMADLQKPREKSKQFKAFPTSRPTVKKLIMTGKSPLNGKYLKSQWLPQNIRKGSGLFEVILLVTTKDPKKRELRKFSAKPPAAELVDVGNSSRHRRKNLSLDKKNPPI